MKIIKRYLDRLTHVEVMALIYRYYAIVSVVMILLGILQALILSMTAISIIGVILFVDMILTGIYLIPYVKGIRSLLIYIPTTVAIICLAKLVYYLLS